MTKDEAITVLLSLKKYYNDKNEDSYVGFDDDDNEALDMAIKALEQQPCEDYISRQAVLKIFGDVHPMDYNTRAYITQIEDLPSVTLRQVKGKWIFDEILDRHYYCSECKSMGVNYWDFCPFCGAEMKEV